MRQRREQRCRKRSDHLVSGQPVTGRIAAMLVLAGALSLMSVPHQAAEQRGRGTAQLDTSVLQQVLGRTGQLYGNVYKVAFPRSDLAVSLNDVRINPGLALGSWVAFKPEGDHVVALGDLVLTSGEVSPVVQTLQQEGFEVTGLHNHLVQESPSLTYVHFFGKGEGEKLARGLRRALETTATPLSETRSTEAAEETSAELDLIQRQLGQQGVLKGGILHISVPRSEPIVTQGTELPPSMGMATALNFQTTGPKRVASTGDFVLTADEVRPVTAVLGAHGVQVTALHNHLLHSSPQLYFMHFWIHDTPERVATALKAGLEAMQRR